jgi:hypothetical protein
MPASKGSKYSQKRVFGSKYGKHSCKLRKLDLSAIQVLEILSQISQ